MATAACPPGSPAGKRLLGVVPSYVWRVALGSVVTVVRKTTWSAWEALTRTRERPWASGSTGSAVRTQGRSSPT